MIFHLAYYISIQLHVVMGILILKTMATLVMLFTLLAISLSIRGVFSFEPAPLQDFCVADQSNQGFRLTTTKSSCFQLHLYVINVGFQQILSCQKFQFPTKKIVGSFSFDKFPIKRFYLENI